MKACESEQFILSFWKYAYWLAHKHKRRREDVDDLAQEALLVVCAIALQGRAVDDPAYYHKAMLHTVYTYLGGIPIIKPEFAVRHRHVPDEIVFDCVSLSPIDEDTIPDANSEQQCDWQWLYDLVDLLPPTQKKGYWLSFWYWRMRETRSKGNSQALWL